MENDVTSAETDIENIKKKTNHFDLNSWLGKQSLPENRRLEQKPNISDNKYDDEVYQCRPKSVRRTQMQMKIPKKQDFDEI